MRKSDICIFCGSTFTKANPMTREHVIPKSWYPDSTPEDIEKWQVPGCNKCNSDFGPIENLLKVQLGLGLDGSSVAAQGIRTKARRAVDPRCGSSQRDSRSREAFKKRLQEYLVSVDPNIKNGILPNLSLANHPSGLDQEAMSVKHDHLLMIAKKIVKGVTFALDGFLFTDDYVFSLHILTPEDSHAVLDPFAYARQTLHRGSGIQIERYRTDEDPRLSIFKFLFWEAIPLHVSVLK